MKKLVVLASLALVGQVHAAKWARSNNPTFFNPVAKSPMNASFRELPLSGELLDNRFGWSETYWPSNVGGIAFRWNSPNPQPFTYKFFTKEELKAMTEKQLSELSPAELYDIAMGDYNYTLTKKVLSKFSAKDLWWEGICHGWSLAASNYAEPDKTVVTNKDGINVPFGSSDVKGLLSMHAAFNAKGHNARVGDRCSVQGKVKGEESEEDGDIKPPSKKDADKAACADVNAGSFHIILASMIGINSQGFVADVDRFNDVWNQPITSYESHIVGEVALTKEDVKNGVDKKIQMKTKMNFGEELVFWSEKEVGEGTLGFVSKEPVTGTPAQTFKFRDYEYVLELDKSGNIIGGEWISESRPDMVWLRAKDAQFNSSKLPLEGLNIIYKPVKH
jgi:hypothetical protein